MRTFIFQYPAKVEPFPQEVLNPLAWWQAASTPQRARARLVGGGGTALTFIPFIPPTTLGPQDDVIHLGTKEALGVTSQPTLGGWQAW